MSISRSIAVTWAWIGTGTRKALRLSQYLHDLGVFLHFRYPPELRRTVFLQNQRVTDAVFRVLDDEQVKS